MGLTRMLAELRTETLSRADLSTTQVPTADLDLYINARLKRLYRILVKVNKDFYLKESTAITVVAGTAQYALASDFWRNEGVEVLDGSSYYKLGRWSFADRNRFQGSNASSRRTGYRIMGGYIRLFPTPAWSGTMRCWYIPAPAPLVLVTDTWDGYAGFEGYAVVGAAADLRAKFEEDNTSLLADCKRIEEEILEDATERDDAEPDRIRDVDGECLDDDVWAVGT